METYLIYKNIVLVVCVLGIVYQLIGYILTAKAVKAHYKQRRWRRWEEEHQKLELNLKIVAFEMLTTILLTMIVVMM